MTSPPASEQPTRRRWWLWGLLGLGVLIAAGPSLLGYTPLPAAALAGALPPEAGRLRSEGVSLSWTGATVVKGIELEDPAGEALFSAERVEVAGGVLALLGDAPLTVRVEQPRVDLVVGPDGTNFDPLLRGLESKRQSESGDAGLAGQANAKRSRPIDVRVIGAAARVTELDSGQQWIAEGVALRLRDPGLGFGAIELAAEGKLREADAPAGGAFEVSLQPAEGGVRQGSLSVQELPLAMAGPFLRRADPTASLDGRLSIEGDASWRADATAPAAGSPGEVVRALARGGFRSAGAMRLVDVAALGVATRGGPVAMQTIDVPWRVAAEGDRLVLQQLDVQSVVGSASVVGSIHAEEVERWAAGVGAAPRDLRARGRLDLERLASAAPQLVRLQPGARIDGGRLDATADLNQGRLTATLNSGPLTGVNAGRRITWREPLDVQLVALQRAPQAGPAGWLLEKLDAKSSFFQATAAGDATRLVGDASFDLNRLANELAQFADLGETNLAGAGQAQFVVTRDEAERRWRLDGEGGLQNLLVGPRDAPLASELSLRFTAKLSGATTTPTGPPSGVVKLSAGADELSITLPEVQAAGDAQPFQARLVGDLARWRRRASVLAPDLPPAEAIGLAGAVELNAAGMASATGGRVDQFKVVLSGLSLDTAALDPSTPRLLLRNERVEASGRASWDVAQRAVQVPEGQAISSVASARVRDALVSLSDPGASHGDAAYRIDLTRLNAWTPPRTGQQRYEARGSLEGTVRLAGAPEGLNLKFNTKGQRLAILDRLPPATAAGVRPGTQTVWSEPQLRVEGDLMARPVADAEGRLATYAIDLRDATIESQMMNGSFGGTIDDAVALRGVQIGGGVDYDLEKVTPLLWPQLGDGVRLVGRERATFRVETDDSAPVNAAPIAKLRATVSAPWASADVFGLPIGAGRLAATLEKGVVRVDPIDLAVGRGRLTAAGAAVLDPPPASLSLRPGPLLTDVAMSPEVNERVLKFIAPVLADATRIDGRYSLTLSALAVPLAKHDPRRGPPPGRAAGLLNIHQVRVRPGPAVAEWVAMVQRLEGLARDGVSSISQPSDSVLVAIDDANVNFRLVEGRVYHNGLVFYVDNARVESSGSVGVDETLDLVLAVPIQEKWIQERPDFLGRLRGQVLRLPIRGTFSKPKIDSDAFSRLSSELIQNAAAGAIEGGLNKLFERLRSR